MSVQFPTVCPEHPGDEIVDDSTLASHHQAYHPETPIGDFKANLASSSSGDSAVPKTAKTVTFQSALSKWSLLASSFHSFSADDVSAGSELTISLVREAFNAFGSTLQPPIVPDQAKFFLELFIAVLVNRGTDKLQGAGGFKLPPKTGGAPVYVKWETIFGFFRSYMESFGIAFVPRKMVALCDELFWELWNDKRIVALEEYRVRGTRASRRWTLPDGQQPRAYVIVPDLFTEHLSSEELALRDKAQAAANFDIADETDSAYHGVDLDHKVDQREALRQQLLAAKRQAKNGGLGHSNSPREDPIMRQMYPDRY